MLSASLVLLSGCGLENLPFKPDRLLGRDKTGMLIVYQAAGEETPTGQEMDDTVTKLKKRAKSLDLQTEIYRQGEDRIFVELSGTRDPSVLGDLVRPGELYFIRHLGSDGSENYTGSVLNKSIEELEADGSIIVTDDEIKKAEAATQKNAMGNTEYVVQLVLNDSGTKKFADATAEAFPTMDSIMIYYDGEAVSIPRVQAQITDGNAVITGMENYEAAADLASILRIGHLDVKLELLETRTIK